MNTYKSVGYSRYNNVGELATVQSLYNQLVELGFIKPWREKFVEAAWHQWEDPKEVSFNLMCAITYSEYVGKLPDEFVVAVGKAFGFNFKFGFWRIAGNRGMNNYAHYKEAERLLREDFTLVYDRDFWAELEYFVDGWLNRWRLFEAIWRMVGSVGIYAGHLHLGDLPDGGCFAVSGGIPRQIPAGTLEGDEFGGWYVATEKGWQKYADHFGAEAAEALDWVVNHNDSRSQLVHYDLHGMDFNFRPKTVRKDGEPMPRFHGKLSLSYRLDAAVTESGELLGIIEEVTNFNGEGYRFTPATQVMRDAWERSHIRELLPINLRVKVTES